MTISHRDAIGRFRLVQIASGPRLSYNYYEYTPSNRKPFAVLFVIPISAVIIDCQDDGIVACSS